MSFPPTLYKARGVPAKQQVCAICADRTRGRTQQVRLTHGVSVWLCHDHASREFQTMRGGRDFMLTLHRLWSAHGCLTANRSKALTTHITQQRERPARPRPGSYAWPELRQALERRFATGVRPAAAITTVASLLATQTCSAHAPSPRTIHRWHAQRRWLTWRPPP
jgi:hypothetical protein